MKAEQIQHLLPGIVQEGMRPDSPLSGLLAVMELLQQPAEDIVDSIACYFNAYTTPDEFVPFLAHWVDLDRFFPEDYENLRISMPWSSGIGHLRELVLAAACLSQWRGTARGLKGFLETATGVKGFSIEEQVTDSEGNRRMFHLRITGPARAAPDRRLIERIIEQEKPAYVTCELVFSNQDSD